MENIEFNKIISFDENSKFERINEVSAVEYFLTCSDDNLKKSFLDKFNIYIKKGLNSKVYTNNTMQDLMFIIFYLYDDPYSLLVQFNRLVEETNGCYTDYYYIINFDNLDKRENQYRYIRTIREMVSDIEISESYSDLSLSRDFKDKLIKYRDDIEFNKRKNSFLKEYGELDIEELKISFDYYMSKEYMDNGARRKSWGFLQGAYSSDRCNRYEIYRQAYTYSLKMYGDEKTKELFNCESGSKYVKSICNGIDLNDYLSIKKLIGLDKTTQCNIYDLSLMLFGSTKYYSCLEDLFKKANSSLEKDFEPTLIYENEGIIGKLLTDLIDQSLERIMTNDEEVYNKISNILEQSGANKIKLELKKKANILDLYDLENQIEKAKARKIWLKCGGFITIDKTEALTAIDVNSGKYVGGKDLEQTVYRVNKEATLEIAKQLRLRDIGGIIIIDYIDMEKEETKIKILEELNECLKKDRSKTQVIGFTPLDLLEMTRKHMCSND